MMMSRFARTSAGVWSVGRLAERHPWLHPNAACANEASANDLRRECSGGWESRASDQIFGSSPVYPCTQHFRRMLMTPIIHKQAASVRSLLFLMVSIAAVILVPCSLKAQTLTSGDIAGTVEDSSGAVIPGADVKAINTGTDAVSEVFTGAAGDYRISLLQP